VLDGPASLAWAANLAMVEIHPWTSTAARPDSPSWALFDLDPGPRTSWDDVLVLARLHRTALEHLGVIGRPVVTGSRGIHIRVPVRSPTTYDATRGFAEAVSRAVADVVPDLVSWKWRKDERSGLARLDVTQNAANKTLAAPYCVRARPGGPVAVALEWDELDDPDLRPDRWTVHTVGERLRRRGDPLAPLAFTPQVLPEL
jgi:bifunctional non-homologous end joining protein LigD